MPTMIRSWLILTTLFTLLGVVTRAYTPSARSPSAYTVTPRPILAKEARPCSIYSRNLTLSTLGDFLSFFTFNNIKDPSGGIVTYVDQQEAERLDLVGPGMKGGIRISADLSERNISAGRKSVRLRGKEAFGEGVFAFEIAHAPVGCGLWPAAWMTVDESVWPVGGEMDIFEYGNGRRSLPEQTLHLNGTCLMPPNRLQTGNDTEWQDCDSFEGWKTGNHGCGVELLDDLFSIPSVLNRNGGAWFVMERTSEYIQGWAFPSCSHQAKMLKHKGQIDTRKFGVPSSFFPSTVSCVFSERFDLLHPIINIGMGGMAELHWRRDGCLAHAPSFYTGWGVSENSTEHLKMPGNSVDFHISSYTYFSPLSKDSRE